MESYIEELFTIKSVVTLALTLFVAYYFFRTIVVSSMQTREGSNIEIPSASDQTVQAPRIDPEAYSRTFSLEDLAVCCGSSDGKKNRQGFSSKQILLCVNGEVYEATSHPTGSGFYGPGKPYNIFAGCDSTVPLARMEIKKELCNQLSEWKTLNNSEKKILADWILRFRTKYVFVGLLEGMKVSSLNLSEFSCAPII